MNATQIIATLAALALVPNLQAQQRPEALSGPNAIIVFVGDMAPRTDGPVTGYSIERRAGDQETYKAVAELRPVADAKALRKGLEQVAKLFPYTLDVDAVPVDTLFQLLSAHGQRSRLGAYTVHTPVLLAAGLAWADTDVKIGTRYQYRVVESTSGTARNTAPVVHAPNATTVSFKPINARYAETDRRLDLLWLPDEGQRPATLRLHRSENDGPFIEVPAALEVMRFGDTLIYALADMDVRRYQLYRYALRTYDMAGNAGPLNDTLYCAALDPTQMPMPARMEARGDSSGSAIRIAWELPNAPLVKHLTLYRSTNSVDGFEAIATLASDRTVFIDEAVRPATPYFYHFVLEYKATHIPMRSHSFAATVYSQEAPEAPRGIHANVDEQQVTLRWMNHLGDAHSFLIYRAEQGAELKLISEPLPPVGADLEMQWSEPVASLDADRMYHYAVRAVSTSHLHSGFSDTATVLSPNMATPPVPKDLRLRHDQEMLIIDWEDVSGETMVAGYQVLRTITPAKGRATRDTLYVPLNFLVDTLKGAGTTHAYQVRSISLRGRHSAFAPEVRSEKRDVLVSPPTGVNAQRTEGAVALTWKASHSEVVRYEVYRYTRGSEPVLVGRVPATQQLALRDDKAPAGLAFYFVRAVDAAGNASAASREAVAE